MKADNVKQLFVYSNITFIVVAGFYVLYQILQHPLNASGQPDPSAAAIFAGFVGMAIQFLTGSEIAKRAEVAANTAFATGAGTAPTVTTSTPPTTTTVTPPTTSLPAQDVQIDGA